MFKIKSVKTYSLPVFIIAMHAQPASALDYIWTNGNFATEFPGLSALTAIDTLTVSSGGSKYLNSSLNNSGLIDVLDSFAFTNTAITNNGQFIVAGNANLNTYAGTG